MLNSDHDDAEYAQALFESMTRNACRARSSESEFGVVFLTSGGYEGGIFPVYIHSRHVSVRPTKSELKPSSVNCCRSVAKESMLRNIISSNVHPESQAATNHLRYLPYYCSGISLPGSLPIPYHVSPIGRPVALQCKVTVHPVEYSSSRNCSRV